MNQPPKLVYSYDAFLSYNSKDDEVIETIACLLEDTERLTVWKDNWELAGGDNWLDDLPKAISRSRGLVAFVSANGIGPWHREEIKIALMRAIEDKSIRLIPVALPGAPDKIQLPDFARSFHVVDMRDINRWSIHLLRCAICGGRPGRRDQFERGDEPESKQVTLNIIDWSIENTGLSYTVRLRVVNSGTNGSILLKSFLVRTHQTAEHPVKSSLEQLFAPIELTAVGKELYVPHTKRVAWQNLEQDRYLIPGEVEDIEATVYAPEGYRCVVSFGLHWYHAGEQLVRLAETGFAAIGRRGGAPRARDSYNPEQQNMDYPQTLMTPDWPEGWPDKVTLKDWAYYGAGEEKEHKSSV